MATTHVEDVQEEAIGYVGVSHDEIESIPSSVQTFAHTEVLNCDTSDVWEACKHAVPLLPDLAPEYFSHAEWEKGSGNPGSISVLHFGKSMSHFYCMLIMYLEVQLQPQY